MDRYFKIASTLMMLIVFIVITVLLHSVGANVIVCSIIAVIIGYFVGFIHGTPDK